MVATGTILDDWTRSEDVANLFTDVTVVVKLWFCESFATVASVDNLLCSEVDCCSVVETSL